jgi:hypothetical protein
MTWSAMQLTPPPPTTHTHTHTHTHTQVYSIPPFQPQPNGLPVGSANLPEAVHYLWALPNGEPCAAEAFDGTFYQFYKPELPLTQVGRTDRDSDVRHRNRTEQSREQNRTELKRASHRTNTA